MLCRLMSYVGIALFLSAVGVAAQDLTKLKGGWVCQSGCGCSPASPRRYTSIRVEGVARNECGAESALTIVNDRLSAKDWNLGATVSSDGGRINWDNGSLWARLPSGASELDIRRGYWEGRTFYCPSALGAFPSKEAAGGGCDDGDSVMFNALLCRMGDPRGCNSVRLSQDEDGRFWRSPRKRLIRPKEPSAADDAQALLQKRDLGETTFSGDHAAGLFLYFGHTRDADAFKHWIRWIDSN
jgi:hypothetical protein